MTKHTVLETRSSAVSQHLPPPGPSPTVLDFSWAPISAGPSPEHHLAHQPLVHWPSLFFLHHLPRPEPSACHHVRSPQGGSSDASPTAAPALRSLPTSASSIPAPKGPSPGCIAVSVCPGASPSVAPPGPQDQPQLPRLCSLTFTSAPSSPLLLPRPPLCLDIPGRLIALRHPPTGEPL